MPSSITAKNKNGISITFTEDDHKYESCINGKSIIYTSVTSFVSKFFKPFDVEKMSRITAYKTNKTQDEVKKAWELNRNNAANFGTMIHESCEDILLENKARHKIKDFEKTKQPVFKNAVAMAKKIKKSVDIVDVEHLTFDPDLEIAGTVDLLAKHKTKNNFFILDWKTNKDLDLNNKYRCYGLGLARSIPDTPYGHYCLQLNLYQYLLNLEGVLPKNSKIFRILLHCTDKGTEKIFIPDYQNLIKIMIKKA
jgi:ATP-dependent exoDNAse (exonuclease V) beta subunit